MQGYNNAIDIQNIKLQRLQDTVINVIAFPTNYEPLIDLMKSDIIQWVKEERYRRQLGLQIGEVYIDKGRLFIQSFDHDGNLVNELMIRSLYKGLDNEGKMLNSVVVARVQFLNRRKGMMTKLYELLEKHVNDMVDLDSICIESVVTLEMEAWCIKNGFTNSKYNVGSYYKILK